MSETNDVVITHDLTKRYGKDILAVDSLDLQVSRGEVSRVAANSSACG